MFWVTWLKSSALLTINNMGGGQLLQLPKWSKPSTTSLGDRSFNCHVWPLGGGHGSILTECCSQMLPSFQWRSRESFSVGFAVAVSCLYIYILWLNGIYRKCRNWGPWCTENRFLSPFVQSGCPELVEILWAIYSLLIRIRESECGLCGACLKILEGRNNVFISRAPPPCSPSISRKQTS